jgi:translocation and assembly module TamB
MRFISALLVLLWWPLASFAQDSDDDPGYLAGLLQDALSGAGRDVRIQGFQGALSSEASIELLTISDAEGEWLRVENVVLDWSLRDGDASELLDEVWSANKDVRIVSLSADGNRSADPRLSANLIKSRTDLAGISACVLGYETQVS